MNVQIPLSNTQTRTGQAGTNGTLQKAASQGNYIADNADTPSWASVRKFARQKDAQKQANPPIRCKLHNPCMTRFQRPHEPFTRDTFMGLILYNHRTHCTSPWWDHDHAQAVSSWWTCDTSCNTCKLHTPFFWRSSSTGPHLNATKLHRTTSW